ncbi:MULTISPECIES: hypothetical protein [unclassified Pseudomonas]|uniref:hypothetical protein n=1 Tax=unclassified Pseudomonas TaxID=196821 RepID=UPI00195634CB|nr:MULTISPECIES: hypothetical protein [unclassified Pseudomonas]
MNRLTLLGLWAICVLASLLAGLWMLLAILVGSTRAWKLAIAYDQLANTALGGHEDETISSRAGKAARADRRWGWVLCRFLDRLDSRHCERSIELDES